MRAPAVAYFSARPIGKTARKRFDSYPRKRIGKIFGKKIDNYPRNTIGNSRTIGMWIGNRIGNLSTIGKRIGRIFRKKIRTLGTPCTRIDKPPGKSFRRKKSNPHSTLGTPLGNPSTIAIPLDKSCRNPVHFDNPLGTPSRLARRLGNIMYN